MGSGVEAPGVTEAKEKPQERFRLLRSFRQFRRLSSVPPSKPLVSRRWARRVLFSLILSLAICIAFFFALPSLMIAPVDITKSDVILHSSISPQSFADEYVADLYRQGVGRKIVCVSSQISWKLYPGDYAREHLISLGVPAEDVISLRMPTEPCLAINLPRVVEFVKSNGWRSALVISHPENSRYAGRLIPKYFEKEGISVAVSYAPRDREELTRNWWGTHWKTQRMVGGVMSLSLDFFYSECR